MGDDKNEGSTTNYYYYNSSVYLGTTLYLAYYFVAESHQPATHLSPKPIPGDLPDLLLLLPLDRSRLLIKEAD